MLRVSFYSPAITKVSFTDCITWDIMWLWQKQRCMQGRAIVFSSSESLLEKRFKEVKKLSCVPSQTSSKGFPPSPLGALNPRPWRHWGTSDTNYVITAGRLRTNHLATVWQYSSTEKGDLWPVFALTTNFTHTEGHIPVNPMPAVFFNL